MSGQLLALLAIGLLWLAGTYLAIPSLQTMTLGMAVVLQGIVAALISRWLRLAPWWWLLQLLFPPALFIALTLHLPSYLSLAGFIVLWLWYGPAFRTQVPFYPSSRMTWQSLTPYFPPDRTFKLIDIGSGTGGMLLNLAARYPDSEFLGVELAPLVWCVSWIRARLRRSRAKFVCIDYMAVDFSGCDFIFAYLSPAAMPALWEKARREMRPGSVLFSNEFGIQSQEPDVIIRRAGTRAPLFVWYM
ncbi:MAG TPA: class I SAM-dependent methyltransferase [Burkholderiales bacterium]|nr:class I SAM-dependent methyltransferase [Burkholderiales bacterium]